MKNIIYFCLVLVGTYAAEGQVFRLGLKAGPNFSSLNGSSIPNLETRTGFHAGAMIEIKPVSKFALQAEALFSAQGAKADAQDLDLSYVAVPVLAKYYLIGDIFALELGPQFSFLLDEAEEAWESRTFDLAIAGGASVNVTKKLFVSARYTKGVTKVAQDINLTNDVIQVSVGFVLL